MYSCHQELFTELIVDYTGRFDRVDRAALVPKPIAVHPDLARRVWREGFRPGGPPSRRIHLLWCRERRGCCGCLEVVAYSAPKFSSDLPSLTMHPSRFRIHFRQFVGDVEW